MVKLITTLVSMLLTTMSLFSSLMASKDKLIEDNISGMIAAFGDFDSDKFTDVFVIADKGKSLEMLRGFPTEPVLRRSNTIKCLFNGTQEIIDGVVASDFTGKAMMDLLVVTHTVTETVPSDDKRYNIWLMKGTIYHLECNTTKPLVANVKSHPFVLDINGDMIADFIVETDSCLRQLWTRSSGVFQSDCPSELQPPKNYTFRRPHSNAFINLDPYDKDLAPDIMITSNESLEYWHDEQGFSKANMVQHSYPSQNVGGLIGQSAFVDINIDGQIDHIIPVCEDKECKSSQILGYDLKNKNWITISDFSYDNQTLTFANTSAYSLDLPITLRHGDIDGDGYADLITLMKNSNNELKAVILQNKKANNTFGRHFVIHSTSDQFLSTDHNVIIAGFIDLFEDGKLDILMTLQDKADSNKLSVIAVVNTQMVDACFLKVLVTSGLCYGSSCPRGIIPYGTNQFGPFVCYQLQDLDGYWQTACAGQLSQSAHSALQMPYSVFGLGEMPNFVETVYASIPSGRMGSRHSKWTQIVPDAQVVLIPFPPNETSYWISKLFYTPSNIVFSTLITLAAICCLLVLIIGILHRKELLEDLAEHEEYKRHWPESR